MPLATEGLLPLLPNAPGKSASSLPVQNYRQRSQQSDCSAIARDRGGEGGFVGEFPPVAAFPSLPESLSDVSTTTGNGGSLASSRGFISGSLASSRGFISAGSLKSSRGFLSRTLGTGRKIAELAGCPPGGMRFGSARLEEPIVASVGQPTSSLSSTARSREAGKGGQSEEERLAPVTRPVPLTLPIDSRTDDDVGFAPSTASGSPRSPKKDAAAKAQPVSLEEKLRQKTGVALHTLHLGDLRRSKSLRQDMQELKLHDYFDTRGTPRFRRLGLSFAAKQNEDVKDSFGSISTSEGREASRTFSTKSYFCASQAILKDIHHGEELKLQTLKSLDEMERFRIEDVSRRQLEMLFLEVPNFERFLPGDVVHRELLPPQIDKDTESKERKSSERSTSYLADARWTEGRRMGWMMTRQEALMLSDFSVLWTRASRNNNCPFGMDRPTFCRMILDLGLVDQEKVPYYWAISLFDSMAQAVRCCPPDATWSHSAPAAFVVNRWALLSIFDTLLRQHYDESNKDRFFVILQQVATHTLPAHLMACVQDLIKRNQQRPISKTSPSRGRSQKSQELEDSEDLTAKIGKEKIGSKFRSKVQAAQVHFKMYANVLVGLQKANDLDIDDDGTQNINSLIKAEEDAGAEEKKDSQHEEQVTVPAWLKPPELSAPNLDTALERLTRDRLVGGMLVEPEVLHLVAQFSGPLRAMHKVYSEANGHMSFHKLLQFCYDFRLIPQLVSSDLVQGAYGAVQNLQLRKEATETPRTSTLEPESPKSPLSKIAGTSVAGTEPNSPSPSQTASKGPFSTRPSRRKRTKTDARDFASQGLRKADSSSEYDTNVGEKLRSSVGFKRTSSGLGPVPKRDSNGPAAGQAEAVNDQEKQKPENQQRGSQGRRQSLPGIVSMIQKKARPVIGRRRSSHELHVDTTEEQDTGKNENNEQQESAPQANMVVSIFGIGAFLEVLCRVAFMHLGSYGNIVQQSSTAYARVVWLITYLRYVFSHMKRKSQEFAATGLIYKVPDHCPVCRKPLESNSRFCRECGSTVPQEPPVPSLLAKALQEMPPDWLDSPETVPEDVPLGQALVQPLPGIGCKKKRRRPRSTTQNTPRLCPSSHTSAAVRDKMKTLARAAKESVAQRSELAAHRRPSKKRNSILLKQRIAEPVIKCTCGTAFPDGEEICPSCGRNREGKSPKSAAMFFSGSSRPGSVASSFGEPESSDESLHREEVSLVAKTFTDRTKEVETPVAKGRRASNTRANPVSFHNQTGSQPERATARKESWSLDELMEAEAGKLCKMEGHCTICEGEVGDRHWGKARCRGCSIVDHFPFEHHPFKRTLKERFGVEKKYATSCDRLVTDLPPGVERYGLTPPPVGDLNSVLEKYFGHRRDSLDVKSTPSMATMTPPHAASLMTKSHTEHQPSKGPILSADKLMPRARTEKF